jgi:hypothetical protein
VEAREAGDVLKLVAVVVGVLSGLPAVGPWMSAGPAADVADEGRWLAPFDGEVPAVNMVLMHDGSVLYWSGVDDHDGATVPFFVDSPHPAHARVVDFAGPVAVVRTPTPHDGGAGDMFCAGQTVLADGSVLVVGGTEYVPLVPFTDGWHVYGLNSARRFDPATDAFATQQPMVGWRWYPTALTLPDGSALVASGIADLPYPQTHVTFQERFDPATRTWSVLPPGADNLLPLYPRLFVVPSGPLKGDVYYAPVGCLWCPFGAHPAEALWNLDQSLDLQANAWTIHGPALLGARQHGTAVPLLLQPPAYDMTLLTAGGTLNRMVFATNTAELASLAGATPVHAFAAPMTHARWHHNSVLLPTGEVLAVGGGMLDNVVAYSAENPPVLEAEVFDPAGTDPLTGLPGRWTELAPMQVPRMYHSTALLLPDGRVLVGGHVPLPFIQALIPQVTEERLEVFEPPYLFRGPRPIIADAPADVAYGAAFAVGTPDAASIASAVLMRPGAVTHAYDNEQRGIVLTMEGRSSDALSLRAPPDGDVAPPGYYMLFLLRETPEGPVPSEARFVRLA